jgi:hypothetical protein
VNARPRAQDGLQQTPTPQQRDEHLYFAPGAARDRLLLGACSMRRRRRSARKPQCWSTGGDSRRRVHCIDSAWRNSRSGVESSYSREHTLLTRQPRRRATIGVESEDVVDISEEDLAWRTARDPDRGAAGGRGGEAAVPPRRLIAKRGFVTSADMAGATTAQIMDVTGHRDPKSLRRYTRRELLHDPVLLKLFGP